MAGPFRRAGLGLLVGAVLLAAASVSLGAQDTTRVKRDTLRVKRDSTARRDTIPVKRDSTARRDTIPVKRDSTARADSARVAPLKPDSVSVAIPVPPDSAAAESARRARQHADSVQRAQARAKAADTLKAPLAHAEVPATPGIGRAYRWDREALFASGSLTLTDLLREVPGFTDFRSGWLLSPHQGTYFGDFRAIRVFYDGLELDVLDQRNNGIPDLSFIPIWTLEDVVVEQGAQELRVYLRSWRVRRTTPNTRVDVATGDVDTNLYRGFFGQRYANGMALQFIAQQFGTQDPRESGDGDQLALFGRVGWARHLWSVDAVIDRVSRSRASQVRRIEGADELPSLDGTRNNVYLRVAYGDPDAGPWMQMMAGRMSFRESERNASSTTPGFPPQLPTDSTADSTASTDTLTSRPQYVLAGGLSRWGLRLSGTGRLRNVNGVTLISPSARAAFVRERLSASVFAERRAEDSLTHADAALTFTPLPFLALSGYASHSGESSDGVTPAANALRGEVGVRVGRLWVSGGVLTRDTASIAAPIVFDTAFKPVSEGRTTAAIAAIRGPVWKAVSIDVSALRYGTSGLYRPQTQFRGELSASTSWLSRFPSGHFHIKAGVVAEYRSTVQFPVSPTDSIASTPYKIYSTLLEIRLLDAVLSWQFRNVSGFPYQQVPGFGAPRAVNFYGVRWDFFN